MNENMPRRSGGQHSGRPAWNSWRGYRVLRSGRELSRCARMHFTTCATRMRLIVCRQEGGAAFMAEAYGKLTGRPGICFVTRGPGATNASIGVHTAYQDSTPMILFIGQVGSDVVEREAFQEMDYRRMFGQMAKWVAQIDRADRIPEYHQPRISSGRFRAARAGRAGVAGRHAGQPGRGRRCATLLEGEGASRHCGYGRVCVKCLRKRKDPWSSWVAETGRRAACDDIRAFIEANNLPAACGFRTAGSAGQPAPELLRRRRHRHQPGAGRSACAAPI